VRKEDRSSLNCGFYTARMKCGNAYMGIKVTKDFREVHSRAIALECTGFPIME
tara:strand:+ start:741 stop:899 length:159 start_codon:yes stop_codon:yes gene_type:complete